MHLKSLTPLACLRHVDRHGDGDDEIGVLVSSHAVARVVGVAKSPAGRYHGHQLGSITTMIPPSRFGGKFEIQYHMNLYHINDMGQRVKTNDLLNPV